MKILKTNIWPSFQLLPWQIFHEKYIHHSFPLLLEYLQYSYYTKDKIQNLLYIPKLIVVVSVPSFILQGVFFSYLRVTKRYLSQDTTSQQPQKTCFHFLLWSTWVENMCFGLLRSCVLRQIPFCAPRVRKMSPWRMWWCWRVLQLLVILSWPHFKARKWWRWRRNWYIEQDNNNLQGVKRVGFI